MGSIRLGATMVSLPSEPAARAFFLLGRPVAHSLSPRMQAAAFAAAGIPATYTACEVAPHELGDAFATLRALGSVWGGANLTLPHKQAAGALVDDLDETAVRAGAINVISGPAGGRWTGFNTDLVGFVAALQAVGVQCTGRRIAVLGAGGMARAVVAAALQADAAAIGIACRDPQSGVAMLEDLERRSARRAPSLRCTAWEAAASLIPEAQILVNATPLGLVPSDPSPIDLVAGRRDLIVVDAAYAAVPTALERAAQARGVRSITGRELLVQQGAAAFALWTGLEPPVAVMRRSLGIEPPR
jgi:shikimate dehydrogenase